MVNLWFVYIWLIYGLSVVYLWLIYLVGGWPTPLKDMKASCDDDIPNWMEKSNKFQTTNQDIPSREQT